MKDFFKTLFSSFFRTIATLLGIVLALLILFTALARPSLGNNTHGFEMGYDHNWESKPFSKTTPTILKITLHGAIGQHITSQDVKDILFNSLDSGLATDQIKGILLSIDSPGGVATDSDTIYRMLQEYKKKFKTPIYAYTDGICASGGYLIACAADKFYVTPSTLIGSIGVIVPTTFNVSQLMDKIGVQSMTITAGKSKDMLNPFRPWKENEGANIQLAADSYYHRFIDIVTANRSGLTTETLTGQGAEIYPYEEAEKMHMIDGVVSLESDALLRLAQDLKIDEDYQVIEFTTGNWLKSLLNEETLFKKELKVTIPGMLPQELQGKFLYLYQPET